MNDKYCTIWEYVCHFVSQKLHSRHERMEKHMSKLRAYLIFTVPDASWSVTRWFYMAESILSLICGVKVKLALSPHNYCKRTYARASPVNIWYPFFFSCRQSFEIWQFFTVKMVHLFHNLPYVQSASLLDDICVTPHKKYHRLFAIGN